MDRDGHQDLERLEWAVRAIAQEADVQTTLYPDFVCVPDELALEFDEHFRKVVKRDGLESLEPEQRTALECLDHKLAEMSGPEHAELWKEDALRESDQWTALRMMARDVISKMGWSTTPPSKERA